MTYVCFTSRKVDCWADLRCPLRFNSAFTVEGEFQSPAVLFPLKQFWSSVVIWG